MLALITVAEQLERAAGGVLAPDIQDTLHMSDTTLIGVSAFGGVALVLGAIPLAWLADRVSRVRIVWIATIGWGVVTALNGLRREPVPAVLHAGRRRLRPGVLGAGVRVAAHRHVSDPGPSARLLPLLALATGRSAARTVRRGRDRDDGRRRRRLAVDLHRARVRAAPPRPHLARGAARAGARPVRAGADPRRGAHARCDEAGAPGLDVDRVRSG